MYIGRKNAAKVPLQMERDLFPKVVSLNWLSDWWNDSTTEEDEADLKYLKLADNDNELTDEQKIYDFNTDNIDSIHFS